MPELPEVETVRRGVQAALAGRRIKSVEITGRRTARRPPGAEEYLRRVPGRRLVAVDRRGKYLLARLDGASADVAVVHLGMSGRLLVADARHPVGPHTHVTWWFDGGAQLRFVDPRTFGEIWVTRSDGAASVPELAHLGVEPLEMRSWQALAAVLAGRRTRIKPALMDQRIIAGIGNIYADEILFESRLHGDRPAGALTPAQLRRLHAAITGVLSEAVAAGGSSLADAQYLDAYGAPGAYQQRHAVYGREGLPCPRCAATIIRVPFGGRSSFRCPRCQRPARAGRDA